jgi:hypothetical protein
LKTLHKGDSKLFVWLLRHPWLCGLLMALSFLLFAGLSIDLARLLWANASFLAAHGWLAVQDAALFQLAELLVKALAAMLGYTGFKLCEHALVSRLAHHTRRAPAASPQPPEGQQSQH